MFRCGSVSAVRRGVLILLVTACGGLTGFIVFTQAASAAPVRPQARITYATPKVSPRGIITIRAIVRPRGTRCTLTLAGPYSRIIHLSGKRRSSGPLQWRYRLPGSVRVGRWAARLSCGNGLLAGRATRSFSVGEKVLKANVAVTSDGFTQSNYGTGSPTFISYGAALHNTTAHVDALNLTVTASFTDTLGRSVASDITTLIGIPAAGTFYIGGLASSNISLTVASMNVTVKIGATQPHRLTLPPVSGLSVQTDSTTGDTAVSGTLQNPYGKPISSLAQIYVVYVSPEGAVVGGASEFANAAVNPGSAVAFGFSALSSDINSAFIPASSVATVQGSMDPCGGIPGPSCPAQISAQTS